MILIVGGAFQGKTAYAKDKYGICEEEIIFCDDVTQCEELVQYIRQEKSLRNIRCITRLQLLIRRLQQESVDIEKAMEALLTYRQDIILLMDEVGLGIVPLQREDRDYRELVGRAGCFLAKRASKVERVLCGVGRIIKQ